MPTDIEKDVIRCPHCESRDVRRSRSRGIADAVMSTFQRVPFRCRGCSTRFYRDAVDKKKFELLQGLTASRSMPQHRTASGGSGY